MTRQSRARWLAFATAVLVVLLAALFTWLRNLTPAPAAATAPAAHGAEAVQSRAHPASAYVRGRGSSLEGDDLQDASERGKPGT